MSNVVYRSNVHIERIKGPLRSARLPGESQPVAFSVHGAIAEHYKVDPVLCENSAGAESLHNWAYSMNRRRSVASIGPTESRSISDLTRLAPGRDCRARLRHGLAATSARLRRSLLRWVGQPAATGDYWLPARGEPRAPRDERFPTSPPHRRSAPPLGRERQGRRPPSACRHRRHRNTGHDLAVVSDARGEEIRWLARATSWSPQHQRGPRRAGPPHGTGEPDLGVHARPRWAQGARPRRRPQHH